ncbi:MAG: hypothetical protein KA054_03015 [Candidatus Moranbacteria bacterium]|nr:hypothetical protein [Candidatus Moranbacteria bacterium]
MTRDTFTLLSLPSARSTKQALQKFPFPIQHTAGQYRDISLSFRPGEVRVLHQGIDTRNFSFVWLTSGWNCRDIAYALRLYFESTGTPHSYAEKNTSKITDSMVFALQNLPLPETVYVSRSSFEANMPLIREICGYPLIIKDIRGSKGKDSEYVATEAELLEKMASLPRNKRFLLQRFIQNEYDWGIMVVNGKVVSGEKSYPSQGEFRNNTCNGAKEHFVEVESIPENIQDIAIRASGILGLSWSRADIIIDKLTGLPYLLEVNRYPGITADSTEVLGAYTFLASHITPGLSERCILPTP